MDSEHGGAIFKYKDHNEGFKRWTKEKVPECLHPFPGQTDGIWFPVFNTELLVTIIVKMPIADQYLQAPHPAILASFKDTAEKHPALKAALTACCDMNVHDHNDKIRNSATTKWVYCKTSTLSEDAINAFSDWIPHCATLNGQELLHCRCCLGLIALIVNRIRLMGCRVRTSVVCGNGVRSTFQEACESR